MPKNTPENTAPDAAPSSTPAPPTEAPSAAPEPRYVVLANKLGNRLRGESFAPSELRGGSQSLKRLVDAGIIVPEDHPQAQAAQQEGQTRQVATTPAPDVALQTAALQEQVAELQERLAQTEALLQELQTSLQELQTPPA